MLYKWIRNPRNESMKKKKFKIGYFIINFSKEISSISLCNIVFFFFFFSIQYSNNQFNDISYTYPILPTLDRGNWGVYPHRIDEILEIGKIWRGVKSCDEIAIGRNIISQLYAFMRACMKREHVPVYIRNTYKVSIITYYRRGAGSVDQKEWKKRRKKKKKMPFHRRNSSVRVIRVISV